MRLRIMWQIKANMRIVNFVLSFLLIAQFAVAKDVETLKIGAKAPDFNLKGVDSKMHTLDTYKDAEILVILFTCNHCPTAQAYESRIKDFTNKYKSQGVQVVGISPNFAEAVRFDELAYTDLGDTYEDMVIAHKDREFNFPYLYDGTLQEAATAYGAVATPHIYIFDKDRMLVYQGRIDDNEHIGMEKIHDFDDAMAEILAGKEVSTKTTKVFGCSIKWEDKAPMKVAEVEGWAKEEVTLEDADVNKIKELVANGEGENYRLINVWATWCGPCVAEFTSLVEVDHMYQNRGVEFITLSADAPKAKDKVVKFLTKKTAGGNNYIFSGGSKYDMIEAIDPDWQGALPYTMLVSPDGEIVYKQMGMIDILELKRAIVDKIGRYFD